MPPAGKSRPTPGPDRDRNLQDALSRIERQFGAGSIMRLTDRPEKFRIDAIPTGALSLDIALGIGGVPRGRVVEIYGTEASGKTTLAMHILAEGQRLGGTVAFIDAEHAFPLEYAGTIGLDLDKLLVSQPNTGEEALEICDTLVRSGAIDAIAVDSVAALVPSAELAGEMGDTHMGLQARLMSQALRKLSGSVSDTRCCAIFINQIREKIGVMFGNPETTPGGRALKFWASVRLEVRRKESLKRGQEVYGSRVKVKVSKNKVAPPFKQAEFDVLYGKGIYRTGCIVDLGLDMGLLEKTGTWYSYGGERLGQGRDNACTFLDEHRETADEIELKVRELAGMGLAGAGATDDEEDAFGEAD